MPKVFTQVHCSVAAFIEREGKILLMQENRPEKPWHGQWNHPAGWLDLGEDPVVGVVREVKEEMGGDFIPEALLGIYNLIRHDTPMPDGGYVHGMKIVFIGTFREDPQSTLAADSGDTHWFTPEEIEAMDGKTLRDVDIKVMVREYLEGKRFPLSILHNTVVR